MALPRSLKAVAAARLTTRQAPYTASGMRSSQARHSANAGKAAAEVATGCCCCCCKAPREGRKAHARNAPMDPVSKSPLWKDGR